MRKIKFYIGEYYHIYNRGIEKRDIFLDKLDYLRFLNGVREFNKDGIVPNVGRRWPNEIDLSEFREGNHSLEDNGLISIICYCLMPNHFHFILRQKQDNGIAKFMHKMGTGYTNYFNLRHERSGSLFQGTFKARHIEDEQYLLHLSRYIHLNPIDIIEFNDDKLKLRELLKKYKWSSLAAYLAKEKHGFFNLENSNIMEQFKNATGYEDFIFNNPAFSSDEFGRLKIDAEA